MISCNVYPNTYTFDKRHHETKQCPVAVNVEPVLRKTCFLKFFYNHVKVINSSFHGCTCKLNFNVWEAETKSKEKRGNMEEEETETAKKTILLTNVDINNCWLVLVTKNLGLKIITIDLARTKCVNLHTFHSVHSCSFKNGIVWLLWSI